VRGKLNVNVKVPGDCTGDGCILDQDALSSLLLLADVAQQGSNVTVTAHACSIQIPPVALHGQPMPTQLSASDMLVQSVAPVTAQATLDGPNVCARMTSAPIPIVLGAQLANVTGDMLPTFSLANMPPVKLCNGSPATACNGPAAANRPCVCDQDGDSKPGATVAASGVPALDDVDQMYLALRTVIALDGQVFPSSAGQATPGQRLKGKVANLTLEQSPLGCHHAGQGGAAPSDCTPSEVDSVARLNPRVTQSVNTDSTFVAIPVPDGETCDKLIADAPTLFRNM
jgi:hypothetical protein